MVGATKKGRGRPPGEGKPDTPYLEQVADLCVVDPALKPTTAMKRVVKTRDDWGSSDETLLRRWQVKWKANAAAFLHAARNRADARHAVVVKPTSPRSWMEIMEMVGTSPAMKLIEDIRRITENSSFLKIMAQLENSPMVKVARELENSAVMKLPRQIEESPMANLVRQMEDSPMLKLARQMGSSPLTKYAQHMTNSPMVKIAEQVNQTFDLSKFQSIIKPTVWPRG